MVSTAAARNSCSSAASRRSSERASRASTKENSPTWASANARQDRRPQAVARQPHRDARGEQLHEEDRARRARTSSGAVRRRVPHVEQHAHADEEEPGEPVADRQHLAEHLLAVGRLGDDEAAEEGAEREGEPRERPRRYAVPRQRNTTVSANSSRLRVPTTISKMRGTTYARRRRTVADDHEPGLAERERAPPRPRRPAPARQHGQEDHDRDDAEVLHERDRRARAARGAPRARRARSRCAAGASCSTPRRAGRA